MRTKPRISNVDDGTWAYTLPAFGFAKPVVKAGFPNREAAGKALADRRALGTASQLVEQATRPSSRHPDMNVPQVYR